MNAWFKGVLGHFPGTMEYISTGWMIGSTCIHQNVEPFLCIIFILYDGLPVSSKRWSRNKEKESDIFDIGHSSRTDSFSYYHQYFSSLATIIQTLLYYSKRLD